MLGPHSQRSIAQGICLLPLLLAPLLGGTADRSTMLLVAALAGAAGLWVGVTELRRGRRLWVSWFALLLLAALLLCMVQLLPLPPGLRALLAPGSDRTLRLITADLGGYPARAHPLSLDAAATLVEAVRMGGYLALLLGLQAAFSHRGDSARLAAGVWLSAGLLAACALLVALSVPLPPPIRLTGEGVTRARLAAGFVNSNHLAALCGTGAMMTLAALRGAAGPARLALLLLLALLNVTLLGTLSRAGIAVGLLGQTAVLLLLYWRRGGGGNGAGRALRRTLLLLGVPVAALLLGLIFAREAQEELYARLASTRLSQLADPGSKVRAWVQALPLLYGHLPLGIGRGAFENAFQQHNSLAGSIRFCYLENEWLQTVVDFGVPGAALLFALLVLGLRDALRRLPGQKGAESPARVAALVALCALGLHNLVDFNLQVGGVAVPALALLCLCGHRRFTASPAWLCALSGLVLIAVPVVYLRAPGHEEDGRRLSALAEDTRVATDDVVRAGAQAVLRHPFDSHLSAVVAARLEYDRRPAALAWVNRALLANPDDVGALRTNALILAARGHRGQALHTVRLALPHALTPQRHSLYRAALQIARSTTEFIEALPESADLYGEVLEFLTTLPEPPWGLIQAVGEHGERRIRDIRGLDYHLAQAALARRDLDGGQARARRLLEEERPPAFLIANLAALLFTAGRDAEAEGLCRSALARTRSADLHLVLAQVQEGRRAFAEARQSLQEALDQAEGPEQKAQVHEAWAGFEERQGNLHRARQERLNAARWRR